MAIQNSTTVLVLVGGTAVAHSQDATISMNRETVDISTKDTGLWSAFMTGQLNATVSVNGLYEMGSLDPLWAAMTAAQGSGSEIVTVMFGNAVSGDETYSASGMVTGLEIGSPGVEGAMTYNASFQLTGAVTKVDNA